MKASFSLLHFSSFIFFILLIYLCNFYRGFFHILILFHNKCICISVYRIQKILNQRSGRLIKLLKDAQVVSNKQDILAQEFSLYYCENIFILSFFVLIMYNLEKMYFSEQSRLFKNDLPHSGFSRLNLILQKYANSFYGPIKTFQHPKCQNIIFTNPLMCGIFDLNTKLTQMLRLKSLNFLVRSLKMNLSQLSCFYPSFI